MVAELEKIRNQRPAETRNTFFKRLFASQTTVQQYYVYQIPTQAQAAAILKKELKRDVFAGGTPASLGRQYQITHATILNPLTEVYTISLARSTRPKEYLTRDYFVVESVSQELAHVIIHQKANVAEIRAPVGSAEKVADAVFDLFRINNIGSQHFLIPIDSHDIDYLIKQLPAGLIDVAHHNNESITGGGKAVLFKGDRRYEDAKGNKDVTDSPNYKAFVEVMDNIKVAASADFQGKDVLLSYSHKGKHVTNFRVSTATSSIRFTEGEADDEIIQSVVLKLNASRQQRERAGQSIIKQEWKMTEEERRELARVKRRLTSQNSPKGK